MPAANLGYPSSWGNSPWPTFRATQQVSSCPPTQTCTKKKILSPSQAAVRIHHGEDCLTQMGREPEFSLAAGLPWLGTHLNADLASQCHTSARSCPFPSMVATLSAKYFSSQGSKNKDCFKPNMCCVGGESCFGILNLKEVPGHNGWSKESNLPFTLINSL